jgi:hypothetical protein
MNPDTIYQASNGKQYQISQGLNKTWFWECGEADGYGFRTLDLAIANCKEHASNPWPAYRPSRRSIIGG